jgi:hypothetical protein
LVIDGKLERRLVARQQRREGKYLVCFENTSHGAIPWIDK